jgi:hypothetical protein
MDKRSRRNGLFNTIQDGELQSYKLMLYCSGTSTTYASSASFVTTNLNEEEPDDLPFNQKQNINKF